MSRHYYNEFNKFKAQWLRNLIAAGHLPQGDVDDRSIVDVAPSDLAGYTQCHFFAGIAGWQLAARIAGWPEDRELWTASLPCQPFSVAGAQRGIEDDRHLWPHMLRLVRACKPATFMGEQSANAIRHGWLDLVADDLENEGYTFRAAVIPACAVGAPHKRDRLWVVANRYSQGRTRLEPAGDIGISGQWHWRGEEDLQQVYANPRGRAAWPKPLVCRMDDGLSGRMAALHAIGDAIVPQVAAAVIRAYMMEDV